MRAAKWKRLDAQTAINRPQLIADSRGQKLNGLVGKSTRYDRLDLFEGNARGLIIPFAVFPRVGERHEVRGPEKVAALVAEGQ